MPNPLNPVYYDEDALVIRIPSKSPAQLHEKLMKGINVAIQSYLNNEDFDEKEKPAIEALLKFQLSLLPNERQLSKLMAV